MDGGPPLLLYSSQCSSLWDSFGLPNFCGEWVDLITSPSTLYLYMTTGKTIALTRQIFVGKVIGAEYWKTGCSACRRKTNHNIWITWLIMFLGVFKRRNHNLHVFLFFSFLFCKFLSSFVNLWEQIGFYNFDCDQKAKQNILKFYFHTFSTCLSYVDGTFLWVVIQDWGI